MAPWSTNISILNVIKYLMQVPIWQVYSIMSASARLILSNRKIRAFTLIELIFFELLVTCSCVCGFPSTSIPLWIKDFTEMHLFCIKGFGKVRSRPGVVASYNN